MQRRIRKPRPAILGLDASLNSSGYAYRSADGEVFTGLIKPGKKMGCSRLWHNYQQLGRIIDMVKPGTIVIEDYAMAAGRGKRGSNAVYKIGEWGGLARLAAWQRGVEIVTIDPTSLKLLATGSGKGRGEEGKRLMMDAIEQWFGLSILQNDEADAFWLLTFGELLKGYPGPEQLKKRLASKLSSDSPGIYVEEGMANGTCS